MFDRDAVVLRWTRFHNFFFPSLSYSPMEAFNKGKAGVVERGQFMLQQMSDFLGDRAFMAGIKHYHNFTVKTVYKL